MVVTEWGWRSKVHLAGSRTQAYSRELLAWEDLVNTSIHFILADQVVRLLSSAAADT